MCLERWARLLLTPLTSRFQYPQSGLCAWNQAGTVRRAGAVDVSVPSIGFMCLERRVRRNRQSHRVRFSTLNRVYVLGTGVRRHPDAVQRVSVPSIGFMCLELATCATHCQTIQRFSTLNRVYVLGTGVARHPSNARTGFSTLNRVYVLGTAT